MSAYSVVEDFERALCAYTGARFAVTTSSCTAAIFLALKWATRGWGQPWQVRVPARTYCSVPMQVLHAGGKVEWVNTNWRGEYALHPTTVYDSARRFTSGMCRNRAGQFQCVSFQTSKILGLEQGGAVLHDNAEADAWLRRARFDGRLDASEKLPQMIGYHCYLNGSTAQLGLDHLAALPRDNADQAGAEDFADLSGLPCFR